MPLYQLKENFYCRISIGGNIFVLHSRSLFLRHMIESSERFVVILSLYPLKKLTAEALSVRLNPDLTRSSTLHSSHKFISAKHVKERNANFLGSGHASVFL